MSWLQQNWLRHRDWLQSIPVACVLAGGLAATALAYYALESRQLAQADELYRVQVDGAITDLALVMREHENFIASTQAFMQHTDAVDRRQFHDYLQSTGITHKFPGIQSMAWVVPVAQADIEQFEAEVRADGSLREQGYPDFAVNTLQSDRDAYVIKFIEPDNSGGAFGLDIGFNDARRRAIRFSAQTGLPATAVPVVDTADEWTSQGFMYFRPVYRQQSASLAYATQAGLRGLVMAEMYLNQLVHATTAFDFASVKVRDITGDVLMPEAIVLIGRAGQPGDSELRTHRRVADLGGRKWQFVFEQPLDALKPANTLSENLAILLGVLVTLCASLLVWSLVTSQQHARALAEKLTAELQSANQELERSNRDLSQFAYVASHDLQTPVRNVITSVTLLESELGDSIDEDTREYLRFLRESSTRMRNLVRDLLYYGRTSRNNLEVTNVDLNEVAERATDALAVELQEVGAGLEVQDDLPSVAGEPQQLERLFVNILSNAIKYRNPHRSLCIQIDCHQYGEQWCIGISDNGVGIEPEFRQLVFEPFKRLHRHDDIAGSGLGLGICKQILENHGGSIEIAHSSDAGTEFVLWLPVQATQAIAA